VKLLFDQNISFRIIKQIPEIYSSSKHVRDIEIKNPTDKEIWDYAKSNGFTIVTFDADFNDLSTLFGNPPKIIWLRIGNTSTNNLIKLFIERQEIINEFISNPDNNETGCLEFDR